MEPLSFVGRSHRACIVCIDKTRHDHFAGRINHFRFARDNDVFADGFDFAFANEDGSDSNRFAYDWDDLGTLDGQRSVGMQAGCCGRKSE